MAIEPNYVPCEPGYTTTTYYCCSDSSCFHIYKQDAQCKRVIDNRSGTLCSEEVYSCPC